MKKQAVTTIFIDPVQRTSVQGRNSYTYVTPSGDPVNTGRSFAKGAEKRYNFPSSSDGTSIVTNLNRMVDNPWYNKDPQDVNDGLPEHYHVGADWMRHVEQLVKEPQITKQKELEIRFNQPEGFLTDKKNLHFSFKSRSKDIEPNYLERFQVILYDRSNRFEDTSLRQALIIELAKVSKKIAPDKASVNPSRHDFFISTKDQALIEKNVKQDIINDAITDLTLLRRNQTPFLNYQVATVLGVVKGMVSDAAIKKAMNDFIGTSGKEQMNNIQKFNEMVELINKGKEGVEKLWIKYVLKQALNFNLMSIKSGHYIWHSKKDIPNLFDLGSNELKVYKLFYDEFIKYGQKDVIENHYKDLLDELSSKGVKLNE